MHIKINARMKWNFVESILSKDSNGYAEKKMQLELNHCIPPITVFDTIKSKHISEFQIFHTSSMIPIIEIPYSIIVGS